MVDSPNGDYNAIRGLPDGFDLPRARCTRVRGRKRWWHFALDGEVYRYVGLCDEIDHDGRPPGPPTCGGVS